MFRQFFSQIAGFATTLMAGGTAEIVLLIVLIVVALILLLIGIWILWKLLGLLGRAILWLIDAIGGLFQSRSAAHKEARRSRPPPVSTAWGKSGRTGLRSGLTQARRLSSADALCVVVVAGEAGVGDLCRSLGLIPPPVASIAIAAGGDTILIDATRASRSELRKLARALPWRRPVDGVAVLANAQGLPQDGVARAVDFARAAGVCVALHMVLPSRSELPAWRVIDSGNRDGDAICGQLAADTVRLWLIGAEREGLEELALAQSRELPGAVNRALTVAPSSMVDVASLGFSGVGLRGAVAQTVARTRPATVPSAVMGFNLAALALGAMLTAVTVTFTLQKVNDLRGAVAIASREAAVPWTAQEIAAVPNSTRVRRISGIADSLADSSKFSPLSPFSYLIPLNGAPRRLGAAMQDSYLLRPLGSALETQAVARLVPSEDAESWLNDAQVISDWIAAWEALQDDPREVDVKALLAAAFGGEREIWPDDLDISLIETGVDLPLPGEGGLDVGAIIEMARDNFNLSMQMWADATYTNGPVAAAGRQAGDLTRDWRSRHTAMMALRAALQDPAQFWLTASEDRSDHATELRILGRALAMGLIDPVTMVETKAAVARIRIDARDQIGQFQLPGLGALLSRSAQNSGSNLQLTTEAAAWFSYIDRVANEAGFASPPPAANPPVLGAVTIDAIAVSRILENLRAFDRFSNDILANLPAAPTRMLLDELASELVLSVAVQVENALRTDNEFGIASVRSERNAAADRALVDLMEIESWLIGENALSQADQVARVSARIADGVLNTAMETLEQEDPMSVHVDPTADGNAVVRRFERGLARLRQINEELVQPFLPAAANGVDSLVAVQWRDIAADLEAYVRGDTDSYISALEGTVRAWADNPLGACDAPRTPAGRSDYLARAAADFTAEVEAACAASRREEIDEIVEEASEYFNTHARDTWPFAPAPGAQEIGPAALAQFLERLHDGEDAFAETDGQLAANFAEHASFWTPGDVAQVRFRIQWRWNRGIELLANHLADARVAGTEIEGDDLHIWRYGEPFSIKFRLARNSPWWYRMEDGRLVREWSEAPGGQGALLRVFEDLVRGELIYETELFDPETQAVETLRITARIVHEDGRPLEVPLMGFSPD